MKAKVIALLVFCAYQCKAYTQSDTKTGYLDFTKSGITFSIYVKASVEKSGIGYTFTLVQMKGSAVLAKGIDFEGKHYDQSGFNNGVAQYLSAINVKSISIRADVNNIKCSGKFFLNYATNGASTSISCSSPSGSGPYISNLVITDIATDGIENLKRFLISSIAKENNSNNTVNNNPTTNNDNQVYNPKPTGTTDNSNPNTPAPTNSINNPRQLQPSAQTNNGTILAKRNPNFDNFNQPYVKVNANQAAPAATAQKPQNTGSSAVPAPIPDGAVLKVPSPNIKIIRDGDLQNLPQRNRNNSATSATNQPKVNAQGYDQNGNYVGLGKFDNTPGTINAVGPGKQRADGLYDVRDQSGNVHIISAADNQKLIQRQQSQEMQQGITSLQEKQRQQFEQAKKNYQAQLDQQKIQQAQMNAFTDMAAQNIANIASGIGSLIAQSKAKKDAARQRQLMLQQQQRAEAAKIQAENDFRRNTRTELTNAYKEGIIPVSTTKIAANKLYYFVYAFDSSLIESSGMKFYISNVVEIARSGDGTWPYKRNIYEGMEPLTPYREIFHGYYFSEEEAQQAAAGLTDLMEKTGASIQEIRFREKKTASSTSGTAQNAQFWDTHATLAKSATTTSTNNATPAIKTDPLWDVNSEINQRSKIYDSAANNTLVKKAPDFWGTADVQTKNAAPVKIDPTLVVQLDEAILAKNTSRLLELIQSLPEESNDIAIEALRAHALLFTDQPAKAITVYKKYIGKPFSGVMISWEEKIKKDIQYFQSKGLDHQHFPMIQALML